jgi:hypothetical protein
LTRWRGRTRIDWPLCAEIDGARSGALGEAECEVEVEGWGAIGYKADPPLVVVVSVPVELLVIELVVVAVVVLELVVLVSEEDEDEEEVTASSWRGVASPAGTEADRATGKPADARFTGPGASGSPTESPTANPPMQRLTAATTMNRRRRNKGVYCLPRRDAHGE